MAGLTTIHEMLRQARVPFTVVSHRPSSGAQECDVATARHWARVVICIVDGEPIEAVIPAALTLHLDRLLELAGGREIRVVDDSRMLPPPLGQVLGRAVFVDVSLASGPDVLLSVGAHVDAISIRWADFARTVKPIVGSFAELPRDRVPAYRLSYRE
jgi:prolyl-tRNA editing enzyme YbaK/EbsC (Cys-tRNA(Pro) deacylase)